jgi:hypothetical protein
MTEPFISMARLLFPSLRGLTPVIMPLGEAYRAAALVRPRAAWSNPLPTV